MATQTPAQLKQKIETIQTKASYERGTDAEKFADLMDLVAGEFPGNTPPEQLAAALALAADAQYSIAVAGDEKAAREAAEKRIKALEAELSKPAPDPLQASVEALAEVAASLVEIAKVQVGEVKPAGKAKK